MRLDDSNIRFNSFEDSIFNPSSNALSIETNFLLVKMVARQKLTSILSDISPLQRLQIKIFIRSIHKNRISRW